MSAEGFYVSVIDCGRTGLLLGPYAEHADALANVDRAKAEAQAVNPWAHFYAFGTCKVTPNGTPLRPGVLNARIGLHATVDGEVGA